MPLKFETSDTWNFVSERLQPPEKCQKGTFRTFEVSRGKHVLATWCCPKGSHTVPGRRGCFTKSGHGKTPFIQRLLHDKGKFKWRHPEIFKMLMKRPERKLVTYTKTGVKRTSYVRTLNVSKANKQAVFRYLAEGRRMRRRAA